MTDSLRSKMIRLAASMPKGSSERKALLNVLAARWSAKEEIESAAAAVLKARSAVSDHLEGLGAERANTRDYRLLQRAADDLNRAGLILYGIKLP